jgi:hypothetical protein
MKEELKPFVVYDKNGSELSRHKTLTDAIIGLLQQQLLWPESKNIQSNRMKIYDNSIKSVLIYDSGKAYVH